MGARNEVVLKSNNPAISHLSSVKCAARQQRKRLLTQKPHVPKSNFSPHITLFKPSDPSQLSTLPTPAAWPQPCTTPLIQAQHRPFQPDMCPDLPKTLSPATYPKPFPNITTLLPDSLSFYLISRKSGLGHRH